MNSDVTSNILGLRSQWLVLFMIILPLPKVSAQSIDGTWKTRGYGMVIEINAQTFKTFEVTTSTCVPGVTAQRDRQDKPGREATYTTPEGDLLPKNSTE